MEITNNVQKSSGRNAGGLPTDTPDYMAIGAKGQIIEGVIMEVSTKISINFNGKEVKVPKSAVQDAKEGEVRSFEITDVSEKGIVLKEVERKEHPTETEEVHGVSETKVGTDNATFAEKLEKASQNKDDMLEAKQLLEKLDSIGNRMTEEDYRDIESEGISLESYNLDRLEMVLNRIKESKAFQKECMESGEQKRKEYDDQIEKIVLHNVVSNVIGGSMARQVAQRLEGANLPVTAANIKRVANLVEVASIATQMSDKAMVYLIDNELAPTIENIYHAQFAGNSKGYQNYVPNYGDGYASDGINYSGTFQRKDRLIVEENWKILQPQVEKIIEDAGIEVNENALRQAKWLFSNELPITEETIEQLDELHYIKNGYDQDRMLEEIVKSYAKGDSLEEISFVSQPMEMIEQQVESFMAEVEEELEDTYALKNIDITDINEVRARRQLEEVRLKMTVQAANQLVGQGIDLHIDKIEQVVNALREIEDDYYRGILYEKNGVQRGEHASLVRRTNDRVNELRNSPSFVLGQTLNRMNSMTLSGLHQEATSMKLRLDKAGEAYNSLMTKPSEELGDTIEKAFGNVDHILEGLELETTIANRRAVKILGYNNMPMTERNIDNIKAYDAKVNAVLSNLHPAVTIEMIKKDINPLNTPIDELNEQINNIKQELGVSGEEKYAQYLWKIEKDSGLSDDQKKAYIGIYRLLNNVEKTHGAAVGQLLHNNREITLRNLLSAINSMKSTAFDKVVDDNYGLNEAKYSREPIIENVVQAYGKRGNQGQNGNNTQEDNTALESKNSYYNQMVKELADEISPKKLEQSVIDIEKTTDKIDNLLDKSVEKLLEDMKTMEEVEEETGYEEEMLKELRDLASKAEKAMDFLKDNKIPNTVKDLLTANQLLKGNNVFQTMLDKSKRLTKKEREKVENAMKQVAEGLQDTDTMEKHYSILEESMEMILNKEYEKESITSKDISDLRVFANGISFIKTLGRRERYEIPIVTKESITNVHLTIISDTKENGKVQVTINSKNIGNISAEFIMKDEGLQGRILCDSTKGVGTMREGLGDLEQRLNMADIEVDWINYGLSYKSMEAYKGEWEENTEKQDTKVLYAVAESFVKNVAQIESNV